MTHVIHWVTIYPFIHWMLANGSLSYPHSVGILELSFIPPIINFRLSFFPELICITALLYYQTLLIHLLYISIPVVSPVSTCTSTGKLMIQLHI